MRLLKSQFTLITIAFFVFSLLTVFLYFLTTLLNLSPIKNKIIINFKLKDVLIGITIYLKTSIDFAIFIGKLMKNNSGLKNRLAIETGTALGNGLGTFLILIIWAFFKEVPFLLAAMTFIAALVLLNMAEEGIETFFNLRKPLKNFIIIKFIFIVFKRVNIFFYPLTSLIVKKNALQEKSKKILPLFLFSLSIPFILGLDDFAGYIPLFSIINVIGFSIGVFFAHFLLNLFLFAFPQKTINFVKLPFIDFLGSIAFIIIAVIGFFETWKILIH